MSNRANSFLKRFKTEKMQRNNVVNWKLKTKTPSNRTSVPSHSPVHREFKEKCQKIQLKSKDQYLIKCPNHPMKRATFESKQSLNEAYCQQCSIKLVKCNMRMIRISERSLCIRAMFQAQIEKLNIYEENMKQMLSKYFETQRQTLQQNFIKVKDKQENNHVQIPYFKTQRISQNEFNTKFKEIFGSLQYKLVQFVNKYQQNNHITNYNSTYGMIAAEATINLFGAQFDKQNKNYSNALKQNLMEERQKKLTSRQIHKLACIR